MVEDESRSGGKEKGWEEAREEAAMSRLLLRVPFKKRQRKNNFLI
jgi:hypothetical protein